MVESFGTRLVGAISDRGPLCVGIDPHPGLLDAWGLADTVVGLRRFTEIALEALAPTVAMLKPQSAFYERFGSAGIAVLEDLLVQAREAGVLVLMDAKRGDIGSTMTAYAQAYLADGSPLAADAITLSPYLGFGSLNPAIELAAKTGRGVFVLALTSNPEGPQVQHAIDTDSKMVAQAIVDAAANLNQGATPLGSVGLVVGATIGNTGVDLSRVNGPILAPGFGAQGATAQDLATVFGSNLGSVIPTTSREVLAAGPSIAALQDAAARAVGQIRAVLT